MCVCVLHLLVYASGLLLVDAQQLHADIVDLLKGGVDRPDVYIQTHSAGKAWEYDGGVTTSGAMTDYGMRLLIMMVVAYIIYICMSYVIRPALKSSIIDMSKKPTKMRTLYEMEHDAAISQANINNAPEICAKNQLDIGEEFGKDWLIIGDEFAKDESSERSNKEAASVHEYERSNKEAPSVHGYQSKGKVVHL